MLQHAAASAGAVLVPLNPALRSAELEYALAKCSVSVLVMASEFKGCRWMSGQAGSRAEKSAGGAAGRQSNALMAACC